MAQKCALLVDARNLMYRAIFANRKQSRYRNQHPFTIMLRFMVGWLDKFKPESVNIFWDAKRSTLWRMKVFVGYKDKPDKYTIDIKDELISTQIAAKAMFSYMGCRQFSKDRMEADDLIYATCKVLAPSPIVVCSSDSDYQQLVFRMSHVKCFDPMRETFMPLQDYDPVIQKALCGDKSDMINGYTGIGPIKSTAMARSSVDRQKFLDTAGMKPYIRNLLLIDLSLCPDLLKNQLYVQRILDAQPTFDKNKLFDLARKYKVGGFVTEYPRLAARFKQLIIHPEDKDDQDSKS